MRCLLFKEELRAEYCRTNIFEFPLINFPLITRSALVPFTWRNCSNQPTMSHKTWPHGEVSLVLFPLDFCFAIFYRRVKHESISKLSLYVWLLCRYESHYRLQSSRGGSTPLYKIYRYVPPHRVGFMRRFGLKTGIHFAHLVWNRVWILRELRDCMNVFIVSIPDE